MRRRRKASSTQFLVLAPGKAARRAAGLVFASGHGFGGRPVTALAAAGTATTRLRALAALIGLRHLNGADRLRACFRDKTGQHED
jgi:hypothetical protein